ncbi:MAG: carboxypeptidase regulatory-like domain-containing protein [Proteobacteria bacterium]|nr:carboxypeptidase regulatory-like domain-containing protein [Pseudomonadota bacterium]
MTTASIGTLISIKPVSANQTQPTTMANIFTEGFEGDFPGEYWIVGDWDATNGADYWDDNAYRSYGGDWSCWCADIGTHNPDKYDDYMDAFMYILVDLSGYSSVTLSYYYWLQSELSWDFLKVMYYSSGAWNYLDAHSGNSGGWSYSSISIPSTATRVGFYFDSDSSNCAYEGAYVDDVSLDGTAVEYYVTVNTDPPGRTFTSDGTPYSNAVTFLWTAGSTHTIATTSPQVSGTSRYVWSSWSDGGAMSHSVTATGEMTYTATFSTEYQHTISTSPSGRSFTIDGSPHSSSQTQWWASGSSHTIGTTSPQTVGTTRYVYSSWSDGGTISHTVSPSSAGDYTATFNTEYQLSVTKNPAQTLGNIKLGSTWYNGVSTASAWFSSSASPAIEVTTPDTSGGTRYVFGSWSGDKTGSVNPTTVTMNSAKSVTANYNTQHNLTVDSAHGTTIGTGWYDSGSIANAGLTSDVVSGATGEQFVFTQWSGDATGQSYSQSDAITMNAPKTATANWVKQYQLTVNSTPISSVNVYADGAANPTGTTSFQAWFNESTTHTVKAEPSVTQGLDTYQFVNWTLPSGTSTDNPVSIMMDNAKSIKANYKLLSNVGWIAGHVYESDGTTPIASANVIIVGGSGSDITDSSGYYNLTVEPGTYNLSASKNGYVTGTIQVSVVTSVTTTQDFSLTYIDPSVQGWAVGFVYEIGTTTPVSGVTVTATGGTSDITSTDGFYNITLSFGSYTLTATKTGYSAALDSITIIAGQEISTNLHLTKDNDDSPPDDVPPDGTIEGYVYISGTSTPINGAIIQIQGGSSATTDSTGYYSLTVSAGAYSVTSSKEDYTSDTKSVTVNSGQTTTRDFYLILSIPPGDDTDSDGLPDSWEQTYFGNLNQDADNDFDSDGLTNLQEYAMDTEPDNDDTDGDGIKDGDDPNPLVPEAGTDEDILTNPWLWLVIILVISAIIGAGLYSRKKKRKPEESQEDESLPESEDTSLHEVGNVEKGVVAVAPSIPAMQWKPLTGRQRELAQGRFKEYKRKLNKDYKGGKLTKDQCLARVNKREVELGLKPPLST